MKKKKRLELKLVLRHGKVECKHSLKYVQDQACSDCQDNHLSELHNSCSFLEERSKNSTTTQKRQNSILSVFMKIHKKDRTVQILVDGVTLFTRSAPNK